jgi:hypothetical protein
VYRCVGQGGWQACGGGDEGAEVAEGSRDIRMEGMKKQK